LNSSADAVSSYCLCLFQFPSRGDNIHALYPNPGKPESEMNGAESMLRTLVHGGVEVCFMNPGTSEIQFVAAINQVKGLRCYLGLFEGVVSGAADGYARMSGKPAATLLHLGPGLANALANFHNARRAHVPIVNIIGDHATYHRACDPPLHTDIGGLARSVSKWIESADTPAQVPALAHAAIRAAIGPPAQVATLILPADNAWSAAVPPCTATLAEPAPARADDDMIREAARILMSAEPAALILNGNALMETGLMLAGRIREKTGARLLCDCFVPRLQRGAGRPVIEIIPYFVEAALQLLRELKHVFLLGARAPVGFFAYPGLPGQLLPATCLVHELSRPGYDAIGVLRQLVEATGAENIVPVTQALQRPVLPAGELTPQSIAQAIAALLPEQAIVVDEAVTSAIPLQAATAAAPPHDWLFNTGGSLGQGMPVAAGAAVACPERRVLSLEADGSGMFTLQALWTQARAGLAVTTVIYANRKYQILCIEHQRAGAGMPDAQARDMLYLDRPELDWVRLAQGLGVPARRVTTAEEFNQTLKGYLAEPGPNLIEAVI
jgi:acetolactate synthase-1/2/3 large subunit